MERMNYRFENGLPSTDIQSSGILLRQLDHLLTEGGVKVPRPWLPCPSTEWCHATADRIVASIINKQARATYYGLKGRLVGGITFNTDIARLNCAYPTDGDSMSKTCPTLGGDGRTCIPGCYPPGQDCASVNRWWACSYLPAQLDKALDTQLRDEKYVKMNNEMVVDASSIVDHLPWSIESFFYMKGAAQTDIDATLEVFNSFLSEYSLWHSTQVPPLLQLDLFHTKEARR
jgi:hypothetical protein